MPHGSKQRSEYPYTEASKFWPQRFMFWFDISSSLLTSLLMSFMLCLFMIFFFIKKNRGRKQVELHETVKLMPRNDHDDNGVSFILSKRKRDDQREEESVGNEFDDCGFPHKHSSSTWFFSSSVHNQQRSKGVKGLVVPKKARSSNNSVRKKVYVHILVFMDKNTCSPFIITQVFTMIP